MKKRAYTFRKLAVVLFAATLGGCLHSSNNNPSPPPPNTTPAANYSIGGTVSGLAGSNLVLRNNGGDDLTIAANGTFVFSGLVANNGSYSVTVLSQPLNPAQTCSVANGTGTVTGTSVTNINVFCTNDAAYTIGGTVTGLSGSGLVLHNNGGNALQVTSNGAFTFTATLAEGSTYLVTVATQPGNPAQICSVGNGTGTVGAANVVDVAVTCSTSSYTVSGSVSGLTGTGLVLQNNSGNDQSIAAGATTFGFTTPVASGASYAVTVLTQPANPAQTCTVANGGGIIGGGNVTDVAVTCTTNTYSISGTITGLGGSGLVLRNNGTTDLAISGNDFSLTGLIDGATYDITVATQPTNPAQRCTVGNGSGTISAANITGIAVSCVNVYKLGGTVSGLGATGLVLQNNGAGNLNIAENGTFEFPGMIEHGASYHVTILSAPANLNCTLQNNGPATATADINGIVVQCVAVTPPPVAPIVPMDVLPGFREMTATWQDTGATYNLYYATAQGCDIVNYTACPGGTKLSSVTPPVKISNAYNGLQYYFRLESVDSGETRYSDEVQASPHAYTFDGNVGVIETGALNSPPANFYVGGSFKRVGLRSPYGAPVDLDTAQLAGVFPQVDGVVNTAISDGVGGWYIGGLFARVGGHQRTGVAHILANGLVDPQWRPQLTYNAGAYRGYVNALALSNGRIYIGGIFDEVNGVPRKGVVAFNTDGTIASDWTATTDGVVTAIAPGNGVIYLAGRFSMINATARRNVAAVDLNGAVTAWYPQPNFEINTLAYDSDSPMVYLGGNFTQIGTTARQFLAAVGTDGTLSDWNPGVNSWVRTITIAGGLIYIGGDFNKVGATTRVYAASIERNGTLTNWDPNITIATSGTGKVYAIAVNGNSVYIGGEFTRADNQYRNYVFRSDLVTLGGGNSWDPGPLPWIGGNTLPYVRALAISGNKVYIGGDFAATQSVARTGIAQMTGDGQLGAWNVTLTNGAVYDIEFAGGYMFICGGIGFVSDANVTRQWRPSVAVFKNGALTDIDVNPVGGAAYVYSMVSTGNSIYLGGNFSWTGWDPGANAFYTNVNAVEFDLGTDPPKRTLWRPTWPLNAAGTSRETVAPIWELGLGVGDLAGSLRGVGGSGATYVGEMKPNLGRIDFDGTVQSIRKFDGTVWTFAGALGGDAVGGDFRLVEGTSHRGLVVFTGATGTIDTWEAGLDGGVQAILPQGDHAYIGGGFTKVGTVDRGGLAKFTNDTNRTPIDWAPILSMKGGTQPAAVRVLRAHGTDRILVGGYFSQVGGTYNDPLHRNLNYIVTGATAGGPLIELPP